MDLDLADHVGRHYFDYRLRLVGLIYIHIHVVEILRSSSLASVLLKGQAPMSVTIDFR